MKMKKKNKEVHKNKTAYPDTARRNKSAEALQSESEEKYRTVLENIEDGYYEVDLAGNFTFFNNALCKLSGYSKEELRGMNNRQFIDQKTAEEVYAMFHKVYMTGEPSKGFDWHMTRKDGSKRYVEASASLLKNSSGKPTGFRGIIRDITERRKVEEQYRILADNITEHVWLRDINSLKIIYISPSVEKMYGYPLNIIKNLSLKKLLTEESFQQIVDSFITEMPKALKTLPPAVHKYSFETQAHHKDGHLLWMDNTISFLRDKKGNLTLLLGETRDITERKKAEKELKESEAKYRLLADHMKDQIWLMDLNLNVSYVSPSVEKLLGYTFEELKMTPLEKILTAESYENAMDFFSQEMPIALAASLDYVLDRSVELEFCCKDGQCVWGEIKFSLIRDEKGSPVSILGEGRNITERKQAQEALRESESKYRLLADHTKDQIWLMDFNFKISYASPSVEKLWGYTLEELNNIAWDKILLPETLERVMALVAQVTPITMDSLDNILDRLVELEMHCKDGRIVWEEVRCSFIRDENGKATAILGQGRDITERKQMETSLKKSEERYRSVFENAGLPLLIMEDSLLVFMVNDRFAEMSGYGKNEIEGKMKFTDFIVSGDHDSLMKRFSRRKEDKPVEYECQIAHRNGKKFDVLIRIGRILDAGQLIASFTDITSRKQAEVALLESRENLQKENIRLRSSIRERYRFCDIIGKSQGMQEVYEFILQAADTQANVIIYGESGTGKELVAKAIHEISDRGQKGFVTVHCGAIPETLMESEFFGYKKGAFTGANTDRRGYLDEADGGTLFLDEIGEIGLNMQVKLLRAISRDGYTPVGSNVIKNADVRIIAATNRNLRDLIKKGAMREDFFYRIHILPIYLPPLRERKDDLPLLVDHFLQMYDRNHPPLPGHVAESLLNYDWPGNVRELQNVLHRYHDFKKT